MNKIKKITRFILITGLFFLGASSIFAQSHGLPSGFEIFSKPVTGDLTATVGGYYSASQKFYRASTELVTPSSYSQYARYGVWAELEKQFTNNLAFGLQLPMQTSSIIRTGGTTYTHNIIGDLGLKMAWKWLDNEPYFISTDLQTIIPVGSQRTAFLDQYIYLGLDGHFGLKPGINLFYSFNKNLEIGARLSYLKSFEKTRVIANGITALDLSNNTLSEISAKFDPRDVINLSVMGYYTISPQLSLNIGLEHWYETSDAVTDIQGDAATQAQVKSSIEGTDAYIDYVILGANFKLFNDYTNTLTYKVPFMGKYAYHEQIITFTVSKGF